MKRIITLVCVTLHKQTVNKLAQQDLEQLASIYLKLHSLISQSYAWYLKIAKIYNFVTALCLLRNYQLIKVLSFFPLFVFNYCLSVTYTIYLSQWINTRKTNKRKLVSNATVVWNDCAMVEACAIINKKFMAFFRQSIGTHVNSATLPAALSPEWHRTLIINMVYRNLASVSTALKCLPARISIRSIWTSFIAYQTSRRNMVKRATLLA